jgi:hypothetical protein
VQQRARQRGALLHAAGQTAHGIEAALDAEQIAHG